ncbi:hypothetical protein, variant 3 [Plasmodium yoelii 17X]|uniref:UBC core domain-containing protein n=1 Tax=Plasmodium yoelii 17X TaxID=1323249 RepID=V7PUL8_PLAYE|nr:hypothetical protein, variant 2 [Plasmodium yoelii 17X]ETB63309.1 hypothetical protein, variant 3 [Plasmodium yoelii 17X]
MAKNRLLIESREAKKQNDPDIFLSHSDYNLYEWEAIIKGPKDSPYEGGKWKLSIKCKSTYPIDPPMITFITKVFHPNVNFTTGIRVNKYIYIPPNFGYMSFAHIFI